jgi:hypothetical protein
MDRSSHLSTSLPTTTSSWRRRHRALSHPALLAASSTALRCGVVCTSFALSPARAYHSSLSSMVRWRSLTLCHCPCSCISMCLSHSVSQKSGVISLLFAFFVCISTVHMRSNITFEHPRSVSCFCFVFFNILLSNVILFVSRGLSACDSPSRFWWRILSTRRTSFLLWRLCRRRSPTQLLLNAQQRS